MTSLQVQSRIDVARESLQLLGQIPQASLAEFTSDFRNVDSALRRLQVTIQAAIDIGSWIIASRGYDAPDSSRSILTELANRGVLPPDAADRWGGIIGFRNRIVHVYDRIDSQIVYEVLTGGRSELAELLETLIAAVE